MRRLNCCNVAAQLALAVVLSCSCPAQPPVTLGTAELAYAVATDRSVAEELELEESQSDDLLALLQSWLASDERRVLVNRKTRVSASTAEDRYDVFIREAAFVERLNEQILADVDGVLASRRKSERFRQLFSQALVRFGHYESLLRLHGVTVTQDQHKRFHDEFVDLARDMKGVNHRLQYETALAYVRQHGHLGAGQLGEAAGKLSSIDLPKSEPGSLAVRQYFRPLVLTMVAVPSVQLELAMSPQQAAAASELRKRLSLTLNEHSAFKSYQDPVVDFPDEMRRWMKTIDEEIGDLLGPIQIKRLNQLLFQQHLSALELSWALKAAGKKFDAQLRFPANDIFAEVYFAVESAKLKQGRKIVARILGNRKADKFLGRFVLPTSPWKHEANATLHSNLRKQATRELRSKQTVKNPRRHSGE